MPTYVYRREDGTTFEIEQRITADPLTTCPTTGQPVTRVISGGTGLIFKGSGFYLTDYARTNSGSTSTDSNTSSSKTSENGSATSSAGSENSASKGTSPESKE